MTTHPTRRIAINLGGGYVPGLNSVLTGTVLAAHELGWEVVGIRDGYEGVLFPERYPEGGWMTLTPALMGSLAGATSCVLGMASRTDPFHIRSINADNAVEEIDRSDDLLAFIRKERIDAVVSIVDPQALSILFKLHRRGLPIVCVPKSAQNQVAATELSFGFNSALSFTVELLDRARQAAQSARRIGVVEVIGEHAGWLALQSATAVCADAVLLPEIPYDLKKVAAKLREKLQAGRRHGLVVVAEGAKSVARAGPSSGASPTDPMRASLSPGARGEEGSHVIEQRRRCRGASGVGIAAPDGSRDSTTGHRPAGQRRPSNRRGSATGTRIRRCGSACHSWQPDRGDGCFPAPGLEVCAARRNHQ